MPAPAILDVRIGPQAQQLARDLDEIRCGYLRVPVQAGVAEIEHRLPVLHPAALVRQLRVLAQARLDRGHIAEHQLRLQVGVRDAGVQREQPPRAAGCVAGGAAHELVHGGFEGQRALLDVLAQRVPGREAVLARDHRLGVVQRKRERAEPGGQDPKARQRGRILRLRIAQQRLGQLLQVFETRTLGQLLGRHTPSMLSPVVRRQAARWLTCSS